MVIRPSVEAILARLEQAFPGARLEVVDESHLHAGHAGAAGGAGHYAVRIEHEAMSGLTRIARHRLVYDALRDWMPERIHALRVDARASDTVRDAEASPNSRAPDVGRPQES